MINKRHNKKTFIGPLPVILSTQYYGPLPEPYPHNPFSWLYFGVKYLLLLIKPVPQSLIPNAIVDVEQGHFKVKNKSDMSRLWDYGFFGKGNLSRSDPTWDVRTSRRLHLKQEGTFELTNEEITKLRREERSKFKSERAKELQLMIKKRAGTISDDELAELHAIKAMLIDFRKSNRLKIKQEREQEIPYDEMRLEDQAIVDPDTMQLKEDVEFVQLQDVEVFFLKLALNVIDLPMSIEQLFFECCKDSMPAPNNTFIVQYVVYHHYRSLGWCARSGIKFGCDYILYKKGPPFSHAEHAIVVMTPDKKFHKSIVDLQTISRVIGSVRKTLVLTYVHMPQPDEFNEILFNETLNDQEKFLRLLKLYTISEVLYRRWVPNRTRD